MVGLNDVVVGMSGGEWRGFAVDGSVKRVGVIGKAGSGRPGMLAWLFSEWRERLGGGGVFLDCVGDVSALQVNNAAKVEWDRSEVLRAVYALGGFQDGHRDHAVECVLGCVRSLCEEWSVPAERFLEDCVKAGVVYNVRSMAGEEPVWLADCVGVAVDGWVGEVGARMADVVSGSALVQVIQMELGVENPVREKLLSEVRALVSGGASESVDTGFLIDAIEEWTGVVVDMSAGREGWSGIGGLGSLVAVVRSARAEGKPPLLGADLRPGMKLCGLGDGGYRGGGYLLGMLTWDAGVDLRQFDLVVDMGWNVNDEERRMRAMDARPGRGWLEEGSVVMLRRGGVAEPMAPVNESGTVVVRS